MEKQEIGICYECSTKDMDSSKKIVYQCDVCNKFFCELHSKPKFPYFVDWETQFDVQGDPEVKAFFYSEYGRQEGHADLEYLRRKIMEMELEEEYQNFLIKTAMDNMNLYGKPLRKMKVPIKEVEPQLSDEEVRSSATRTYHNKFKHEFPIPAGIYSIDEYYDRLNYARTLAEVDEIIDDFKKHYGPEPEKPIVKKKKHWWQ